MWFRLRLHIVYKKKSLIFIHFIDETGAHIKKKLFRSFSLTLFHLSRRFIEQILKPLLNGIKTFLFLRTKISGKENYF